MSDWPPKKWQIKEWEARRSLISAQRNLTTAMDCSNRPHRYCAAIYEINAAIQKLATAQQKLIKAESLHKIDK
jgi:hypothetical protein